MDEGNGSKEMSLFHGTAGESCMMINHTGFNRSFHGKNGKDMEGACGPDFHAHAQSLNNGLTTRLAWGSLSCPRVQLKSAFYIVFWYNAVSDLKCQFRNKLDSRSLAPKVTWTFIYIPCHHCHNYFEL